MPTISPRKPFGPEQTVRPCSQFASPKSSQAQRQRAFGQAVETLESRRLLAATPLTVVIGGTNAHVVTFVDASGNQDKFSIAGPGVVNVQLIGTGLVTGGGGGTTVVRGSGITVGDISATGTRPASNLTLKVGGGQGIGIGSVIKIGGITTDGPLSVLQGNVDVTGAVSIGGSVNKVVLTGIDGPGTPANFIASSINTLDVSANEAETFTVAGNIGNVKVGGNLTGGFSAASIRNLSVSGSVTGSNIDLTQPFSAARKDLRSLAVTGSISTSNIIAAGSIGPVTAGSLSGDNIFAGVSTTTTLPTSASQITADASITYVIVHGYAATNVAAFSIGRLALGALQTSNSGTPFGIAGAIVGPTGGTASIDGRVFSIRRVNNQATANSLLQHAGLTATGVDFNLNIL